MRKILLLFLVFSFLMVDAQKKKRSTAKKGGAKKTAAAKSSKSRKGKKGKATKVVEEEPQTPPQQETPKKEPIPLKPVNSLSILNADSPEALRHYRNLSTVKKGDSLISVKNNPVKYGYVEDKDIVRSMVVWEIIDMNERINRPFYYNVDGLVSSSKSLYQLLLDGVNSGAIKEVYRDEMFTQRLTPEEIKAATRYERIDDAYTERINAGEKISEEEKKQYIDVYETKSENVKLLKIKGMWYIDRRDGQMKYRLLGIAAMGKDPSSAALSGMMGPDGQPLAGGDELIDLFWIFYPNAREILSNAVVFNSKNLSSDITFDDLLNARRFSSIIYRSENGFGTGVIKDYIPNDANAQLEESERIKNQILEMENDMWNY